MTPLARTEIVAQARRWIGTPYMHQASLPGVGCDCLGLVRGVWRATMGPEPQTPGPYSPDWAEASGRERLRDAARAWLCELDLDEWREGDVLLFRWRPELPAKHIAIASSRTRMIHAHEGATVCEVALNRVWRSRIAFAFAFPNIDTQE